MNTTGTHTEGLLSLKTKEDINKKYYFVKITSEGISPSGDEIPVGIVTDTAKKGDFVTVQVIGSNAGTLKVLAHSSIQCGERLVAKNSKAVSLETLPAGSYQVFGIALNSVPKGQYVEFTPAFSYSISKK